MDSQFLLKTLYALISFELFDLSRKLRQMPRKQESMKNTAPNWSSNAIAKSVTHTRKYTSQVQYVIHECDEGDVSLFKGSLSSFKSKSDDVTDATSDGSIDEF